MTIHSAILFSARPSPPKQRGGIKLSVFCLWCDVFEHVTLVCSNVTKHITAPHPHHTSTKVQVWKKHLKRKQPKQSGRLRKKNEKSEIPHVFLYNDLKNSQSSEVDSHGSFVRFATAATRRSPLSQCVSNWKGCGSWNDFGQLSQEKKTCCLGFNRSYLPWN